MVVKGVVSVMLVMVLSVTGFAVAHGSEGGVSPAAPAAPGEGCVPAGSVAAALLAAARAGAAADLPGLAGIPLTVTSEFQAEPAVPGVGRPHGIEGPVHVFREASDVPGTTAVTGFVKCDFHYGVVSHPGGELVEFGERPASLPDAPRIETPPAPVPEGATFPPVEPAPFHSIDVAKHIYRDGSPTSSEGMDPINVVFYDTIRPTLGQMLRGAGYNFIDPDQDCYGSHPTIFWDQQHGGSNSWQYVDEEYGTDAQWGFPCYHDQRHHVRLYESRGGDTHNPGFKGYILAPTHQDKASPGPQSGQDWLWSKLAGNSHLTVPPRSVKVPTGVDECGSNKGNCQLPNWNGRIDLYEAGSQDQYNPEEGPQCGSVLATTWVSALEGVRAVRYECNTSTFGGVTGNEWWVQVNVGTGVWNGPSVSAVSVRLNGGAWQPLTKQTWGGWAASYHITAGTVVQFRAQTSTGRLESSPCYQWIPATGQNAPSVACDLPFQASFSSVKGNEWWVEVKVTGNHPIRAVEARVGCTGAWRTLTYQSWGAWAASFQVTAGSKVDFRAQSGTAGSYSRSGGYLWGGTPTPTTACPTG